MSCLFEANVCGVYVEDKKCYMLMLEKMKKFT